jgi:hypothetical protein
MNIVRKEVSVKRGIIAQAGRLCLSWAGGALAYVVVFASSTSYEAWAGSIVSPPASAFVSLCEDTFVKDADTKIKFVVGGEDGKKFVANTLYFDFPRIKAQKFCLAVSPDA